MGHGVPGLAPASKVASLLAEGTRVYVLARVARVIPLEGGRFAVTAHVDFADENGFHQICVPIERVFLTSIAQAPMPPERAEPSLERLTDRIINPR
jgi:hypothetical protein